MNLPNTDMFDRAANDMMRYASQRAMNERCRLRAHVEVSSRRQPAPTELA